MRRLVLAVRDARGTWNVHGKREQRVLSEDAVHGGKHARVCACEWVDKEKNVVSVEGICFRSHGNS